MRKKWIACLMSLCMIIGSLNVTVIASEPAEVIDPASQQEASLNDSESTPKNAIYDTAEQLEEETLVETDVVKTASEEVLLEVVEDETTPEVVGLFCKKQMSLPMEYVVQKEII